MGLMVSFCWVRVRIVERIVKPSVKRFNINILDAFIIHEAIVYAAGHEVETKMYSRVFFTEK